MTEKVLLQTADYVVTTLMLLIPMGIGVFFAVKDSKNATRDEYLLGGRRMSMLPVALSIFVTFISAISLMGTPSDIHIFGSMAAALYMGFSLSYITGLFTMIPLMYPLHLTSLYEYLSLRFESQFLRMSVVAIGMLQTICYLSVALLTPALGLQAAAGIPLWISVAIVGLIGTLYTALGGIKSVVWTDAFQSFVMFAGIIVVVVKASLDIGGGDFILSTAYSGGRVNFNAFDLDPRTRHTWWGTIIGGFFMWQVNIFNQSTIQRICAMKTIRDARKAFLINIPVLLLFGGLMTICGIVLYAYFMYLRCDPFEGGLITSRNQLTPYFVLHVLQDLPGMAGLFMATLFSGGLSTISSGINSLAANTVEDILKRPLQKVKETTATLITKIIVCVYGLLIVGLAYAANSIKGQLTQMALSIFGACGGPSFGVFFLGASIPKANKYGAFVGGMIAIVFNIWMALGNQMYGKKDRTLVPPTTDMCFNNFTTEKNNTSSTFVTSFSSSNFSFSTSTPAASHDPHAYTFFIYDLSYEWYGFIGSILSFTIGVSVSLCTTRFVTSKPNPKLFFPFARKFWSLPEPIYTEANESNLEAIKMMQKSNLMLEEFAHTEFILAINGKEQMKEMSHLLTDERQNSLQ